MPDQTSEGPAEQTGTEDTSGKKPLEAATDPALQDPKTFDDYQDAMGDLADGDQAASMGGPAI